MIFLSKNTCWVILVTFKVIWSEHVKVLKLTFQNVLSGDFSIKDDLFNYMCELLNNLELKHAMFPQHGCQLKFMATVLV